MQNGASSFLVQQTLGSGHNGCSGEFLFTLCYYVLQVFVPVCNAPRTRRGGNFPEFRKRLVLSGSRTRGAINPEPSDVTPIVSISHVAHRPEVRQTAFREIAPHCRQA